MVGNIVVNELPQTGRVMRRPVHTFQLRQRPFAITPFLLAPVLPGETMKNLLLQSRAVTDPIKNPLVGWWLEYYLFYVKHRDLDERDMLTSLMLNPATSVSSLVEDAQRYDYYQFAGGMKWTEMCLKRVVEEYFRDEGESWDNVMIGGYPAASINGNSVLDSITDVTTMPDTTLVDEGGSGDLTTSELETSYMYYEHLRALKLVNMSYEDWLRTFGVRGQRLDPHKPELIRYVREWQYPSNTVDPSNGTPRSAVSWSIAERADKDRFFTEPGFIFGVSVARPKTYLRAQKGSAAGLLTTAMSWLPAVLEGEPYASLLTKDASDQFITTTNGYVVDVRDLFLYGDQFINFDPSADLTLSAVDLPTAALTNKRYPDEDDSEDLFVDDDDSESATRLRQDGVVNLQILGRQVDHT